MCTPWASDRIVLVPDWAGLARFSGEWRKFKGWNPVRVPPRAQCFPCSGACGPLSVHKLFIDGPLRGLFCWLPVLLRCLLSYVVDGSGLCCFFMGACGFYYMTLCTWEAVGRCIRSGWYFTSVHCLRGRGRHDGTVGRRGADGVWCQVRVAGQGTRDRPGGLLDPLRTV